MFSAYDNVDELVIEGYPFYQRIGAKGDRWGKDIKDV